MAGWEFSWRGSTPSDAPHDWHATTEIGLSPSQESHTNPKVIRRNARGTGLEVKARNLPGAPPPRPPAPTATDLLSAAPVVRAPAHLHRAAGDRSTPPLRD